MVSRAGRSSPQAAKEPHTQPPQVEEHLAGRKRQGWEPKEEVCEPALATSSYSLVVRLTPSHSPHLLPTLENSAPHQPQQQPSTSAASHRPRCPGVHPCLCAPPGNKPSPTQQEARLLSWACLQPSSLHNKEKDKLGRWAGLDQRQAGRQPDRVQETKVHPRRTGSGALGGLKGHCRSLK